MINAVIDIGSNSIRISIYKTENGRNDRIYTDKRMIGLAGYITKGELSNAGIALACEALAEFTPMIEGLGVKNVSVFATAALRNISNSAAAVKAIEEATGYSIEVLSGPDEARLGYYGAAPDISSQRGVLCDIGGGSTEIVFFNGGEVESGRSLPMGSLNLYSQYVSEFLPKPKEIEKIKAKIDSVLSSAGVDKRSGYHNLYGIGGSARAAMKLSNRLFGLDPANRSITEKQLTQLRKMLCSGSSVVRDTIIKVCPDRIHTIIPGVLILDGIAKKTGAKKLTISRLGIREGYLCQRILSKKI